MGVSPSVRLSTSTDDEDDDEDDDGDDDDDDDDDNNDESSHLRLFRKSGTTDRIAAMVMVMLLI